MRRAVLGAAVLAIGAVLLAVGYALGGGNEVWMRGASVCLSCIGLGQ